MSELSWVKVQSDDLRQDDFLSKCYVPIFGPDFGTDKARVPVGTADLIILTQSCDLEADKVRMVALCPVHSLHAFEETNPEFKKRAHGNRSERAGMKSFTFFHLPQIQKTIWTHWLSIFVRFTACLLPTSNFMPKPLISAGD